MAFWRFAHGLNLKQKPPILERLLQIKNAKHLSGSFFFQLLGNRALELAGLVRKLVGVSLQKESIKTAAMLNRLERVGTDAETIGEPHGIADQADIAQIGQKAPSDLVVGMAHIVACQWVLACQLANSSHVIRNSAI